MSVSVLRFGGHRHCATGPVDPLDGRSGGPCLLDRNRNRQNLTRIDPGRITDRVGRLDRGDAHPVAAGDGGEALAATDGVLDHAVGAGQDEVGETAVPAGDQQRVPNIDRGSPPHAVGVLDGLHGRSVAAGQAAQCLAALHRMPMVDQAFLGRDLGQGR